MRIIYGLDTDDMRFILKIDDINQGTVRLRHVPSSGMDISLIPISEKQFKLLVSQSDVGTKRH